jgi:DNA-binding NarL/FixJ family response regulator
MLIGIVFFEDNVDLRKTLVNLLNNDENYIVLGDYDDVSNVVEIIKDKLPEVVVLDINMPGMSGIEAIFLIKEIKPDLSIIMYTQFEDEEKLFRCLCSGADGYILKKTSPFKLVEAIDEVCKGGTPLSPTIGGQLHVAADRFSPGMIRRR